MIRSLGDSLIYFFLLQVGIKYQSSVSVPVKVGQYQIRVVTANG